MKSPIKILAIARMELSLNRGTPIRVRNILMRFANDPQFHLSNATWDEISPITGGWFRLSNTRYADVQAVVRYVRKHDVDLVIGHTLSSWFLLLAVKLFTRAKIMLEMHGFPEEEALLYGDISRARYQMERILYALVFRNCDLISTCSETAAEHIRRYNSHTLPVYGGVDTNLFNPEVVSEPKSANKIRIGYVGNGRVWQGVPFLLNCYERYLANESTFELAVLLSEQKGLRIPSGVTVHPPVQHEFAPRFLASCDILVIPRPQNEVNRLSFPSKLIEYMAMGKPVVASTTSDCHRVITNGVDGMLYEPGDAEGFVRAIATLKNHTTRARIGAAAVAKVEHAYTWDHQTGLIKAAILALF